MLGTICFINVNASQFSLLDFHIYVINTICLKNLFLRMLITKQDPTASNSCFFLLLIFFNTTLTFWNFRLHFVPHLPSLHNILQVALITLKCYCMLPISEQSCKKHIQNAEWHPQTIRHMTQRLHMTWTINSTSSSKVTAAVSQDLRGDVDWFIYHRSRVLILWHVLYIK